MTDFTAVYDYFSQHRPTQGQLWINDPRIWPLSGRSLVDRIQPGESVLDVGCGTNPFRGLIPGIVGLDPAYADADLQLEFLEYRAPQPYDVILALSVFNWGSNRDQHQHFLHMNRCLRPQGRVYLRLNPWCWGSRRRPTDQSLMWPYHWTPSRVRNWSQHTGFALKDLRWDRNPVGDKWQIYAELEKTVNL